MQPSQSRDAKLDSVDAVFAAMADRLPPPNEQCVRYSEFVFSEIEDFRKRLAQNVPVILRYENFWLRGWERHDDFFFCWTLGFFGSLLGGMVVLGVLGFFKGNHQLVMAILCGLSLLAGLGVACRYSYTLPPMAQKDITLINGQTRELIYACALSRDKPVDRLVRVPFSDLVIRLSPGQIADQYPSFISVELVRGAKPSGSIEDRTSDWKGVCLTTVDHNPFGPLPEDLERSVNDLAECLGARYVRSFDCD